MEERLKKFAKLIDAGTYTAAAKELHTSQPALTNAIQKLSRELKGDVLVSGSRTLRLSAIGQIAYAHGRELILAEQNLRTQLAELTSKKQPLTLGCIDSVADIIVEGDLLFILERDSELSLVVHNTHDLLRELQKGELDMAITADQIKRPNATEERFLGNERFALVCSPAQLDTYEAAAKLGNLPNFLAYNHASNTYKLVQAQLQINKLAPAPRMYSTNPSVLLRLALQGKGIAALPVSYVAPYLHGRLVEIELKKPLYRPIVALWQTGRKLPASVEDFLDATEVQLV